jgi:TolB protein
MSKRRHRIVTLTLDAAVFIVIVTAAASCSNFSAQVAWNDPKVKNEAKSGPTTQPAAPSEALAHVEATERTQFDENDPPVQVNIFGEFDGVERKNTTLVTGPANLQQHTFVTEGYDADVAIDATGKWMAYASTRHNEQSEIYVQRVDGLSVTQLTNDQAADANPSFSPDGQRLAYASNRSGSWDLYVMDIDGRNRVQVTAGPTQDLHPTWSPDGTMLCYSSLGGRSDQWELWLVNVETMEKRMIGYGLFPSWSPDKKVNRIAFQRARQRGSRWFSLWTMDLVDGEARRVTEVAVSTNAAIVKPSWSPDGKSLAFSTIVEPAKTNGGKPLGQQDIWAIDSDGTNRRRLTDGAGSNLMPFWAVDNRVYFVSDRGGKECVWSIRVQAEETKVAATE